MIRILMLDLGDTLVRNDSVLPNVPEALTTIRDFETTDSHPLELCLVSDFLMPEPPVTPAKINILFQQYLGLLNQFNLKQFFEPVERRITLSTQAGVRKADRKIFELAVRRLGIEAQLSECLFVTENAEHIAKCKNLGMSTLQFGPESDGGEFDDWADGPLLISQLVTPDSHNNLELGLKLHLATNYGMELISMKKKQAGSGVRGQAHKWHPGLTF
jgi:FMN phosphatase YigB (HAD superfamily)